MYDLWQKDESGSWGKNEGIVQGAIRNVNIGAHQVKVWKAVPLSTASSKRAVAEL